LADACEICGFPLSKKIIGNHEYYFFYDAIDLYNLGHHADAEKLIRDKQNTLNDIKITLLLEKIEMGNNLIKRGEECATRAQEQMRLGNLQDAMNEIKAAVAIFSSPRFAEIEKKIQQEQTEKENRERAHSLFEDSKALFANNSLFGAIQTMQEAIKLDSNNSNYKAEYDHQVSLAVSNVAQQVHTMLAQNNFRAAETALNQILPYSTGRQEIKLLNEEIQFGLRKIAKKKRLLFTISVILVAITLIGGMWYLTEINNVKSAWKQVLEDGSIPAMEEFIAKKPDSKYLPDAIQKLTELKSYDSAEWAKANLQASTSSMQEYIASVSSIKGLYVARATKIIDSIDWFAIERSEDPNLFEKYISTHATSQYISMARRKISDQVTVPERDELLAFVNEFYRAFTDKDLESIMLYFEPITPNFGSQKNITKADLRVLFGNDMKTVRSVNIIIDPNSFKAKRVDNNNYYLTYYTDTYLTRIRPSASEEEESTDAEEESTDAEFFTNTQWSIKLNENKKIVFYNYKIISEKQIN
jgi:hypothetical protein